MLVGPMCCQNGYFVESCEAATTIVPSVGISQKIANDLDTLRSVFKILTCRSIPVCITGN